MFAELKGSIAVRKQVKEELAKGPEVPEITDLYRELDQAREIVKAFLLTGEARLHEGLLGKKVAGWRATKTVFFPKDNDPSQSDKYLIVATADFPKPVPVEDRKTALNSVELVIVIRGDHHTETKATLYPTETLYDTRTYETMVDLAYAKEVVEMIRRDPYVGKTILVPNPA